MMADATASRASLFIDTVGSEHPFDDGFLNALLAYDIFASLFAMSKEPPIFLIKFSDGSRIMKAIGKPMEIFNN